MQVLRKEGRRPGEGVFVDFEKAEPSEVEAETYAIVQEVLDKHAGILEELEAYQGAGEPIRQAIMHTDSEEQQTAAWDAVCPLVGKLRDFFLYSSEIEKVLPPLLEALCSDDPIAALEHKQALTKQFAQILHFGAWPAPGPCMALTWPLRGLASSPGLPPLACFALFAG